MNNARRLTGIIAVLCIAAALGCYLFVLRARAEDFQRRYEAADVLLPDSPSPPQNWQHTVSLPDGSTARITAKGGIGGSVQVTYSPTEQHFIYQYVDYIYPSELRLSADRRYIFALVSGLASGIFRQTDVYEFDLHEHALIASHPRK